MFLEDPMYIYDGNTQSADLSHNFIPLLLALIQASVISRPTRQIDEYEPSSPRSDRRSGLLQDVTKKCKVAFVVLLTRARGKL